MTPEQLAKSGTEHGEQRALFAWAWMAERYGFLAAFDEMTYIQGQSYIDGVYGAPVPVPELARLFAIPNGGFRDKVTAAKLKQEGVKRGVPDIFLPLPMLATYAGLFIEMKRSASDTRTASGRKRGAGNTSNEQDDWIAYLRSVGYACSVCFDWRSAARDLQMYIEAVRKTA